MHMSTRPTGKGLPPLADPARGSSLASMKAASRAKDDEEKLKQRRKRGVLVQILAFLAENGYTRSFDTLQAECGTSLSKFQPADNVDLNSIFTEFEEYAEFKFGRRPKFFRVVDGDELPALGGAAAGLPGSVAGATAKGPTTHKRFDSNSAAVAATSSSTGSTPPPPPVPPASAPVRGARGVDSTHGSLGDGLIVRGVTGTGDSLANTTNSTPITHPAAGANARGAFLRPFRGLEAEAEGGFQGRSQLMKPLPVFPTVELNEIAMTIHREILDRDPGVTFNDIAELHGAKQLLKEAVVMPSKYPQLFSGLLRPWKGILLFGPPGTGKTMLAKAVATECRTTFFNISAASIVSKWRGDSEKTVRMLFDLAVHFAPSTVFIDELDSVLGARTSDEHEATRRMKTEFLVQMDGLAKRENGDVVFVLAASNHPWDLDSAVLRRLEKRIHVGLPSRDGREAMFRRLLPNVEAGFDFPRVAAATEGYSGADIDILCREATMRTVRVLIRQLETAEAGKLPTSAVARPVVTVADVLESLEVTRASVNSIPTAAYSDWERKFGSTISGDRERPAPSAPSGARTSAAASAASAVDSVERSSTA